MQFRTNNGMNVSEWSQIYKFKTNGDVTPPGDPENLDWVATGESFVATWDRPSLDGPDAGGVRRELRDLKDYEVTVEANNKTKVYYTVDNTFDFNLVMNAQAFGGIELTVKITVKARDLSLNKSAGVTKTATEDTPPTPSTPIVTNTMGQITLEWDGSTSVGIINPFNLEYVAIHASTTTNFTPSTSTLVGRFEGWIGGRQKTIVTGLTYGQVNYFKLVSVNKKGKTSPASGQASGTPKRVTGLDIDSNAQLAAGQMNFTARQLGGANAFYGTTTPTGSTAPDGTAYKEGDIFYNTAVPPATNAGKTYRRNAASAWVEDTSIGVISGSKLLANTVTASAIGTNLIISSSANIGNAVIDDANIANIKSGKIVAEETKTNLIIANTANIKDAVITSAKIIALTADKITTGSLAVNQKIIAGPETSDHAEMSDKGFRVYTNDQIDGVPREVIRMGTDTNDFFGVVNSAGNLVASVDDTGRASFTEVNTPRLYVAGREIAQVVSDGPRGEVAHFLGSPGFDLAPIFNPVGVAEVGFPVYRGRSYIVKWRMSVFANANVQMQVNGRWTNGVEGDTITQAPAPTINSPSFAEWRTFPAGENKIQTISGEALFVPAFTSRVRFGFTAQVGSDGNIGYVAVANRPVEINVTDVGVHKGNSGTFTNMGGNLQNQVAPPPPVSVTQQYFSDIGPSGRASWQGNGQLMTWAGNDVYQGYNGTNGNTRGQFWFDLPNIVGTVDRVDLWVYFRHWYFNSGGTMRLGITDQRGVFTDHSFRGLYETGGWPKPGGREIMLPPDWWPLFNGTNNNSFNGRGTALTLGPGVGNNQVYYGVATDARLRIYYTQ